eukprot:c26624_g1_i1.p1 GENE.c26624_g1_i1~~c26624_g1_i1.p1  ORF type:complete len:325 (+),score=84.50 c26624_g1_i1:33-977(+)
MSLQSALDEFGVATLAQVKAEREPRRAFLTWLLKKIDANTFEEEMQAQFLDSKKDEASFEVLHRCLLALFVQPTPSFEEVTGPSDSSRLLERLAAMLAVWTQVSSDSALDEAVATDHIALMRECEGRGTNAIISSNNRLLALDMVSDPHVRQHLAKYVDFELDRPGSELNVAAFDTKELAQLQGEIAHLQQYVLTVAAHYPSQDYGVDLDFDPRVLEQSAAQLLENCQRFSSLHDSEMRPWLSQPLPSPSSIGTTASSVREMSEPIEKVAKAFCAIKSARALLERTRIEATACYNVNAHHVSNLQEICDALTAK